MILKDADDRSADIAALKHLRDSAAPHHRAKIQKQIDNIASGSSGESSAAHFLKREFGTSDRTAILNDLRLELDGETAQIDHLVIHRVQATAWVLETKNYSGRLSCDAHGDWTVWYGNKPRSVPSPINQARRQCQLLRHWLEANHITSISKIEPVVLISPNSSVNRSKLDAGVHVVKSDNFGEWWNKQTDALDVSTIVRMIGKHVLAGMSEADLIALGQKLVEAHQPIQRDWCVSLRLPETVAEPSSPGASAPTPEHAGNPAMEQLSGPGPWVLTTDHGAITITQIPSGAYAIRNEKHDALIEVVKRACKGRGRWNPRYRNWLIAPDEIDLVLVDLNRLSQ